MKELNQRVLGTVKWFGGYNNNTGKENHYGFISPIGDDDPSDVYVHRNEFASARHEEPQGTLISFRVDGTARRKAVQVRRLSEEFEVSTLLLGVNLGGQIASMCIERIIELDKLDAVRFEIVKDVLNTDRSWPITWRVCSAYLGKGDFRSAQNLFDDWIASPEVNHYNVAEVPLDWFQRDTVLGRLSDANLIAVLSRATQLPELDSEMITNLCNRLKELNRSLTFSEAQSIPSEHLLSNSIRQLVPKRVLVDVAWSLDKGVVDWTWFDEPMRLAVIFRAICQGESLPADHPASKAMADEASSKLLTAASLLYRSATKQIDNKDASGVYDLLEEWISEEAQRSNERLSLNPVLPLCEYYSPIEHCEARPWPGAEKNKGLPASSHRVAFCPRFGGAVHLLGRGELFMPGCHSAHLYPLGNRATLAEVLAKLLIPLPRRKNLNIEGGYANWLGGAINRLNDIRKLLVCVQCKLPLRMSPDYALNLARYRSTVASCRKCQVSVYFNHCWHCGCVIDSRLSRHKAPPEDQYYVCIKCGAGTKSDEDFIGTMCPNCGELGTMDHPRDGYGAHQRIDHDQKICRNCDHSIIARKSQGVRLGPQHLVDDYQAEDATDPAFIPK